MLSIISCFRIVLYGVVIRVHGRLYRKREVTVIPALSLSLFCKELVPVHFIRRK